MSSPSSRYALLSVSDKAGLVPFAQRIAAAGFTILSTGGTLKQLTDAGIPAVGVSKHTGSPEVFGGRVKSLHPRIHGGILQRRDLADHAAEAATHDIPAIDLVVVNLYPFRETVAKPDVRFEDAVENIDIGGPAMVRASAKNHAAVTIVCSPEDYDTVAEEIEREGATSAATRRRLALKAFRHTAAYDAAIATWLATQCEEDAVTPDEIHAPLERTQPLRYGENPHQRASLYAPVGAPALGGAQLLQGKELSYNNVVDLDAAWGAVLEHGDPAAVVIKHTNPCGVGRHETQLLTAWDRALEADPISAFGGIVAFNRPVDGPLAARLAERFLEVIAAPGFDDEARSILGAKTALRLVDTSTAARAVSRARTTLFGTLVQEDDALISQLGESFTVVSERQPTEAERVALEFLWRVCKHVKSNAIVIGSNERTFGVGAGQMSRVDAVELAVRKATASLDGAALASDAFFPFRDGLDAAARAGVRAVIQPGGSKRDDEVIAAANEQGIAMVFTGHRHFRH